LSISYDSTLGVHMSAEVQAAPVVQTNDIRIEVQSAPVEQRNFVSNVVHSSRSLYFNETLWKTIGKICEFVGKHYNKIFFAICIYAILFETIVLAVGSFIGYWAERRLSV